jgi:hypothetical protein
MHVSEIFPVPINILRTMFEMWSVLSIIFVTFWPKSEHVNIFYEPPPLHLWYHENSFSGLPVVTCGSKDRQTGLRKQAHILITFRFQSPQRKNIHLFQYSRGGLHKFVNQKKHRLRLVSRDREAMYEYKLWLLSDYKTTKSTWAEQSVLLNKMSHLW